MRDKHTPTAGEIAWAAGLFEGEGYIGIVRNGSKSGASQFYLRCSLSMIDAEPPVFLMERWGGTVRPAAKRDNARAQHRWTVRARMAAAFLGDIQPFVRTERVKDRLTLALAFQAQKSPLGRGIPGYSELQSDFFDRLRVLNQRGIAP